MMFTLLVINCLFIAGILLGTLLTCNKSYSDGLSEEQLPPFTMNGKQLVLSTKLSPAILTAANTQNKFIEIKLFDYETEELVQNVSYVINLEKDGQMLINDIFRSKLGPLKMIIELNKGDSLVTNFTSHAGGVYYTASGEITIRGPILMESGLYHLSVGINGIDNIGNNSNGILNISHNSKIPRFDSWLSVADVLNRDIVYNGSKSNVTVISYYDKIKDFEFNSLNKIFSWDIPFDWNVSRILNQSILVHQEIKIPRALTNGNQFTSYNATINNFPASGKSVAIDPFSSKNSTIIHLVINKPQILQFVKEGSADAVNKVMHFTLKTTPQEIFQNPEEILTDTGSIYVSLLWDSNDLKSNVPYSLHVRFLNAADNTPLSADVTYSLKLVNENGEAILNKTGFTILFNQSGSHEVEFPNKGTYNLEVSVDAVSPLNSDAVDSSRNGVARGRILVRGNQ